MAISNPDDLDKYNLAQLDVIVEHAAFEGLTSNLLDVQFLDPPVTPERLEAALREGVHVLHYVGHGVFSQCRGQAALYMQDNAGHTQAISDNALAGMLAHQGVQPRLVFLAACQSGARETSAGSTTDAFLGLGPKLVQAGVPAVVAMQDQVAIVTARKLGEVFYRRLAEYGLVDLALNEARRTLLTEGRPNAGVPTLFMRLEDGQLFRWDRAPPAPFMVDDLPADFVPRPAEFEALIGQLLDEKREKPKAGNRPLAITTALRGAGGYGKTTLTLAVCHDERVRWAFRHSILWVTPGQEPGELIGRVVDWIEMLSGERPGFSGLDAAKAALAKRLEERECLLVIDAIRYPPSATRYQTLAPG